MRLIISCTLLVLAMISLPLQADPLDDARASGQVVEMPDGYIQAKSSDATIKNLVTDINKRRRVAYQRIASKNGVSVSQVATESYVKRTKN